MDCETLLRKIETKKKFIDELPDPIQNTINSISKN
jgi:hypothetical protein